MIDEKRQRKTSGPSKDLTGIVFGRLTVLYYVGNSYWMCRCSCKNLTEKPIKTAKLNNGHTKSCGCINKEHPHNYVDLTGKTSGLLTILSYEGDRKWLCKCECGGEISVNTYSLTEETTICCGCLYKDRPSNHRTHGLSKTREYFIWYGIKKRCYSPNCKEYHNYGGRGIKMCDRWLLSALNFIEDMGKSPTNKHSIDRIDNNGDYSPENCRWATQTEQMNNTRINQILTYNGKSQSMADWGRELEISNRTLWARLNNGWSIEKTLSTPLDISHRKKNNETTN